MLLVLNLPLVGIWVKLLHIPRPYLYAGILMFAALGVYAVNAVGVRPGPAARPRACSAFAMRRFGLPIAPAIIGLILGPMAEDQLRRALAISQGDVTVLVSSPFALVAYGSIVVLFVAGIWLLTRGGPRGRGVRDRAERVTRSEPAGMSAG